MKIRQQAFVLAPPGEHEATLIQIKKETKPSISGKEQLRFVFELDDGSQQLVWVNTVLSPLSKLYAIATALLAKNPPLDLDTDDLINLRCRLFIEHYTGENGKQRSKVRDFAVSHAKRQQEVPF